jgi:hypothetical protein
MIWPTAVTVFHETPSSSAICRTGLTLRPTPIVAHTAARHVTAELYLVAMSGRSSVHVGSPPGHDQRYLCHTNTARCPNAGKSAYCDRGRSFTTPVTPHAGQNRPVPPTPNGSPTRRRHGRPTTPERWEAQSATRASKTDSRASPFTDHRSHPAKL